MDKEQGRKLLEHLDAHWKGKRCAVCGAIGWEVDGIITLTLSDSLRAIVIGGPALPLASITCTTCGNTLLMNLAVAGVLAERKSENESREP